MVHKVTDMEVGDELIGKALMPAISDERVVLRLVEKRPTKGDKFEGLFMGISIGRFVAEERKSGKIEWRRENLKGAGR